MKTLPLMIVTLVLAGCAQGTGPASTPSPSPSDAVAANSATPQDCATVPPRSAFAVGTSNECFVVMAQRFPLWLGENTLPDGTATQASPAFTADTSANVANVQRIMGDSPDGWLGPQQWTRLLTQTPPPMTQLRTSGIGPLWFGMTGDQLNASGLGRTRTDPEMPPDAELFGAGAVGCYDGETFYAAYTKGPSDVVTVEGISASSTVADLKRTFGQRLTTFTYPDFPEFHVYTVLDGSFGYAFIPQADGTLLMIAGISREVENASKGGPHGICGL